jgi:hypothetical protein
MESLATAIIAGAVALVVAVLTPAVTSLRARRQEIDRLFDEAINALLLVQAARHISTGIDRRYHPGADEQFHDFLVRMSENSIEYFITETRRARGALVAVSMYVPEARGWVLSGWELTEEREDEQRHVIDARRHDALRSERLLRQSSRRVSCPPQARPND